MKKFSEIKRQKQEYKNSQGRMQILYVPKI